ncbi:MAG TPA: glycoside hydrolase domain-containing protein, partial [Bacteroidales bacterium]|nr:glycoside hydrolase domain-containing protein [Bacteroidales bacterium]
MEPFDSASEIGFNEGNSAQYTWNIPHALDKLVEEMGGKKKTMQRLDYFTSRILTDGWNVDVPFFWPANQPSFVAPFVYNYAGAPEKAQVLIRHSLNTIFSNSPGGL